MRIRRSGAKTSSRNGFSWIDVADRMNSVLSYVRRAGDSHAIVVLNMTPEPRANYRVGVPTEGSYEILLSSDSLRFGGSGYRAGGNAAHGSVTPSTAIRSRCR